MLYFINPPDDTPGSFSGVFLHETSYCELLDVAEKYYGDITLPLRKNCYMLITRDKSKMYTHVGTNVSLFIHALCLNEERGYLVGLVQLKNNFTDNIVPHIIIAKQSGLLCCQIKSDCITGKRVPLPVPIKVSGKIGVMTDSIEETPVVRRIESNLYVERYIPPPQLPQPIAGSPQCYPPPHGYPSPYIGATATAAAAAPPEPAVTPEGDKIYRGPRGGNYILKDGKRVYLKTGKVGGDEEINIMLADH